MFLFRALTTTSSWGVLNTIKFSRQDFTLTVLVLSCCQNLSVSDGEGVLDIFDCANWSNIMFFRGTSGASDVVSRYLVLRSDAINEMADTCENDLPPRRRATNYQRHKPRLSSRELTHLPLRTDHPIQAQTPSMLNV